MKNSRLQQLLRKAEKALGKDWERCDDDTGAECRGEKCQVGAHRAMNYIEHAMVEADRAAEVQCLLLTAIKIGLQKHEPYTGYRTTMLRQALQKATDDRRG